MKFSFTCAKSLKLQSTNVVDNFLNLSVFDCPHFHYPQLKVRGGGDFSNSMGCEAAVAPVTSGLPVHSSVPLLSPC